MVDEEKKTDAEFTAPEWINTDLIQKALEKSQEGHLQVQDISVRIATAPGDNCTSNIYRVTVALSNGGDRSFVVKGPASSRRMSEATARLGHFRREGFMLYDVIPQIEALLEEAAPGRFPPLAARCPLYGAAPVEFLVLQDLAPAGFKMADRKRGLDMQHGLMAMQSLARYHAGSHALLRKRPNIADQLPNTWSTPHPKAAVFMEGAVQTAADACRRWPRYEEYSALLEKFKPVAMETFVKINTSKAEEFPVIVHNDFWVNNVMFQFKNESLEPQDCRIVDFQVCTVGPATLDLLYFLSTSVMDDISADDEDLLIREYHSALEETLRLLKLEAPPLERLLRELDAHGPFALMSTLSVVPQVRAERIPDPEAAMKGDAAAYSSQYEDAAVKRWMQRVLPEYKRRGWLLA